MANAWLLRPLPNAGAVTTTGTPISGAGAFAFNDYAGIVCQLTCDAAGNTATIRFDLGDGKSIDALLVFGLEMIPAAATITLAASATSNGAYSPIASGPVYAGSVRLTSGKGVAILTWAAVTARFLQITFTAPGSGAAVRFSRIVVGKRLALERNFGFGGGFGVRDLGSVDFSPRGVMLRRRSRKMRTAALTFSNMYRDEVEAQIAPLIEIVGNTEPIALVSDPAPGAYIESKAYFGPLIGDLSTVQRKANAWEAKVNLVSLF